MLIVCLFIQNAKYSYAADSTVPTTIRYYINQFLSVAPDGRMTLKDALKNTWINHRD